MADAVFLDRDGVINEDFGYLHDHKDLRLIPGSASAIHRFNELSIPVIVVSNQAGVARGYFSESHIGIFHDALSQELKKDNSHIDRFYYCPHHPSEGKGKYALVCDCRKPMPGLLLQAGKDMNLDLEKCVLIGDKASDIGAGVAAGCQTILVMTGYGANEWETWHESFKPSHVAQNLLDASTWLLNR